MADKRTYDLDPMSVTVAFSNGILVIDTVDLAGNGQDQQKAAIQTILKYFALTQSDFAIGNLNLKRVLTNNNNVTEVLLRDSLGNIKVRDISSLLAGTDATTTETTNVINQLTESIVKSAISQRQINEQNVGKFIDLEDKIDNITNVGAYGTIYIDPTPFTITTIEQRVPFATLFDSTDENIIEIDEVNNLITYKANGIYQHDLFVGITNATTSTDYTVYTSLRNADTLAIINEIEIPVPEDGYTGTWTSRFEVVNAPVTLEFTAYSTHDTNIAFSTGQANIASVNAIGIPDTANEYVVNIFGTGDPIQDVPNIQAAISTALNGYTIRLFGDFVLDSQIDIYSKEQIKIDAFGAFIQWQITGGADFTAFTVYNCTNVEVLNIFGNVVVDGIIPNFYLVDMLSDLTPNNAVLIDNVNFSVLSGTITQLYLINDIDSINTIVDRVYCDRGTILINDGIVKNCNLTDTGSRIEVNSNCVINRCICNYLEATGSNNRITLNDAVIYTVDAETNVFYSNLNQDEFYFPTPLNAGGGITTTTLLATGIISANGGIEASTINASGFVTVNNRSVFGGDPQYYGMFEIIETADLEQSYAGSPILYIGNDDNPTIKEEKNLMVIYGEYDTTGQSGVMTVSISNASAFIADSEDHMLLSLFDEDNNRRVIINSGGNNQYSFINSKLQIGYTQTTPNMSIAEMLAVNGDINLNGGVLSSDGTDLFWNGVQIN